MTKSYEIKYLLTLVDDDPSNWIVRKEAALKLYEAGEFLEAANVVWQTPEIPSTDMDVAFAVKMISRARPNRSIRLVYELWSHNAGKAEQNIAMANVFNLIGFPMLAMRCYGAAMALNDKYFDIGFESESFLADDSKVLASEWGKSRDQDLKKSFSEDCMELRGYPIRFKDLNDELDEASFKNASEAAIEGDAGDLGLALQKFNTIAAEPAKFVIPSPSAKAEAPKPPAEPTLPEAPKLAVAPKLPIEPKLPVSARLPAASKLLVSPKLRALKDESEEAKSEEVKSEEVKSEEVKSEEVKSEEVKSEEVKSEEVKSEEVKSEEVKSEDVKESGVKGKPKLLVSSQPNKVLLTSDGSATNLPARPKLNFGSPVKKDES
jgi:hypothetical protein